MQVLFDLFCIDVWSVLLFWLWVDFGYDLCVGYEEGGGLYFFERGLDDFGAVDGFRCRHLYRRSALSALLGAGSPSLRASCIAIAIRQLFRLAIAKSI